MSIYLNQIHSSVYYQKNQQPNIYRHQCSLESFKSILVILLEPTNVIVHCSAGVGRTGTFIALYKLMEKIDEGIIRDTIDIYNEVFQLRQDRCFMVSIDLLKHLRKLSSSLFLNQN